MATINDKSGSEKQNFRQLDDGDNWSNIYLPAICAGVVMTIVLLMAVSCSKKSDSPTTKISAPVAPAVETPAAAATPAMAPATPKKAVKKVRPANATYVNSTYGVSFSYPRKYSLQAGSKEKEASIETGFTKPGAVQIVSVDMPESGYPETDFSSALLNVSVHQGVTAEECGQFAGALADTAKASTDSPANTANQTAKPSTLKLGSNEFTEMEQMKGTDEKQSDLKYFHVFKNGACYEFALDVETSRKTGEELAQVDRGQVFRHLEKILTTARIKDVDLPGVENAQQPTAPETKAAPLATAQPVAPTTQTEKAQVLTPEKPEQK